MMYKQVTGGYRAYTDAFIASPEKWLAFSFTSLVSQELIGK
ncbi:hypothetical protein MNBD_GAMMA09-2425 [hydrothermal vent metagenome]|uniref:Uncharacterized protein n=1 Tax=hydrothermal vent metagenome TaxID=652676 RepID=A0A3B0Y1V6_9ZZZZ